MSDVTEPASTPRRPTVAAAIVASHRGVLVGGRRDGNPLWTLPAAKIEPGESPEDAAVREIWEETGLFVCASGVICSRIHPQTAHQIVCVTATSTLETEGIVHDRDELTEVRWVSLAEADRLMGGKIYEAHPRVLEASTGEVIPMPEPRSSSRTVDHDSCRGFADACSGSAARTFFVWASPVPPSHRNHRALPTQPSLK